MGKRSIDGIEIERSSGNVFADLGLPDAEKLKIKSGLVFEITKAMRSQNLTQQLAATRMGISQPKVSDMLRGNFSNLSERKLMDCLNRLGYDIEIKVVPTKQAMGHLTLAFA
jgi:predicted XRE-type DNA-binding protein